MPPNVLGVINDGFFLYLADLGNAGPDRGQGGKYLLLPPGYEGDVPEGYFVFRSSTWRNWVMARGFEQDTGRGEAALAYYKAQFKVLPAGRGRAPAERRQRVVQAERFHFRARHPLLRAAAPDGPVRAISRGQST